ncbi:MAG TPA: histidinol dehydrogenase [Steroidobacteraceae bacterium]|nr:histidinol dehydrogenase [Steroidobacteraceae bacterium]HNS28020.1 histidinol dehydrogenase [Steroidobacteraceae bacterium]
MTDIPIHDWSGLDAAGRARVLARPHPEVGDTIHAEARAIVDAVRGGGDEAVRRFTSRFDGVPPERLATLAATPAEFAAARGELGAAQIRALERAIANVESFHAAQRPAALSVETMPGVRCERVVRPIGSVGLYVPAGSAPLPSAVIMLAVPARLAGCPQRVLCSAPDRAGRVNAAVLVAAQLCGIDTVFRIGGAQAIAAMAYGTASVPKVDKIFGPGNAWVTAAKQLVAGDPAGAALDLPAGPSEVLVIADGTARADFVAADLLAQAEHDPLAQAVLVTDSRHLAGEVVAAIGRQLPQRSRQRILAASLQSTRIILVEDIRTAIAVSNAYAPEHLLLQVDAPRRWLDAIDCAGSVFVGPWSPEPIGDYCSGANHVLPTYGYARACSGLSLQDFTKQITVQELTAAGLAALGPTASTLAQLEGLDAHAAAVDLRLAALGPGA